MSLFVKIPVFLILIVIVLLNETPQLVDDKSETTKTSIQWAKALFYLILIAFIFGHDYKFKIDRGE